MVKSLWNENINYYETDKISTHLLPTDKIYTTILQSNKVFITIGLADYQYSTLGVISYPIYLILKNGFKQQVGVYEKKTKQNSKETLVKFPLLFSFATEDYIFNNKSLVNPHKSGHHHTTQLLQSAHPKKSY